MNMSDDCIEIIIQEFDKIKLELDSLIEKIKNNINQPLTEKEADRINTLVKRMNINSEYIHALKQRGDFIINGVINEPLIPLDIDVHRDKIKIVDLESL